MLEYEKILESAPSIVNPQKLVRFVEDSMRRAIDIITIKYELDLPYFYFPNVGKKAERFKNTG